MTEENTKTVSETAQCSSTTTVTHESSTKIISHNGSSTYQTNGANQLEMLETVDGISKDNLDASNVSKQSAISNRNKNNASSIFGGWDAIEDEPKNRGRQSSQNFSPQATVLEVTTSTDSSATCVTPNRMKSNILLNGIENAEPLKWNGIGAPRQHSNVPPGGFCSDFWKNP